ncbi:MAG TPA: (2Fe-2S)-binding protein [Gammaproteobacteria bacterium]|nr:(2Fe-2S)-binding protein [Gammaproteobacteria bacterium]
MADTYEITVNAVAHVVDVEPDTPLLYVLQNDLSLKGPRFGCGLAQCGSCSVLLDGVEMRSCVLPISAVGDRRVTTLEGLALWYAEQRDLDDVPELHPVQQAMIDTQAIQCGYCFNGMMVKAAELLENTRRPSEAEIKAAMNGHLCRCGMYPRIVAAIQEAATAVSGDPA